jgi:outer membrane protein assembly factor BamD
MVRLALIGVLGAALVMGGCGIFGKDDDVTRAWSERRLFDAAKERMRNGDFDTAIDYYGKLEARYPFGPYTQQAMVDTAYAYYRKNEPASAVAAADRFIQLHPMHPNVDYAYYVKGLAHFSSNRGILNRLLPADPSQRDTGQARQAFRDFEELTRRFPDSPYAADSAQRMQFLKNTLAEHELHVADYYMRRGAYLAAVNRAKYVVENYQGAPAVADALVMMVRAYRALELDDLSRDALRVLRLNFPDHRELPQVERLVQR